ncbi:MAG: 3-hydroxyacyl-CoA dehydrogenase family protein [Treponema sp.]|jgi:3-hydroxybutyryl-CoA dehydrogenase|nr:3-hydroxyacyl-CoA dehydrogenase family protein [Treponema sp.]
MAIKTVGVIGAGVMGGGIAQVTAMAGYGVTLRDVDASFLEKSISRIEGGLGRLIEKGKLAEDKKKEILERIIPVTALPELGDVDLVIEAVPENLEIKRQLFCELDSICKPETVFASNTSSISITQLAASSGRPDRFCGLHFFNPVPVMKLVEIISGLLTGQDVIDTVRAFAEGIGKAPVLVKKDRPGFIVNRLLVPYLNEAVRILEEGIATAEDIDKAVEFGLNYPLGPFKMLDTGGIDLTVTVLDYFKDEYNDNSYAPRATLKQLLRAGKLGRKSGEGFYKY